MKDKKQRGEEIRKEYCECCKKYQLPERNKLETGGYLHICPNCGLSLSASLPKNKSVYEKQFDEAFGINN